MRTVQVGGVFRFHDRMAQFPAESVRVGEEIGVIIDKSEENSEKRASCQNERESPSMTRVVQVEKGKGQCFDGSKTPSPSTFSKQPVNEDKDSPC